MYSKEEAAQLRQTFWTTFGQYMLPVQNAEGEKVNWINYKTGVKGVRFKMDAGSSTALIGVEISHKETGIQQLYFEQFLELKKQLHNTLGEEWNWEMHQQSDQGNVVSIIYTELMNVNLYQKKDWPLLITFFKQRILALDEFWSNYKYAFDALL